MKIYKEVRYAIHNCFVFVYYICNSNLPKHSLLNFKDGNPRGRSPLGEFQRRSLWWGLGQRSNSLNKFN